MFPFFVQMSVLCLESFYIRFLSQNKLRFLPLSIFPQFLQFILVFYACLLQSSQENSVILICSVSLFVPLLPRQEVIV